MNDTGKLVLRLTLGILILLHGMSKLMHGIGPIQGMVTGMGLPAIVAYGVFAGEVLGPLLLIVGFYARIGAALIAANMLFAFALAHTAAQRKRRLGAGIAGHAPVQRGGVGLMGPGRFGVNQR